MKVDSKNALLHAEWALIAAERNAAQSTRSTTGRQLEGQGHREVGFRSIDYLETTGAAQLSTLSRHWSQSLGRDAPGRSDKTFPGASCVPNPADTHKMAGGRQRGRGVLCRA